MESPKLTVLSTPPAAVTAPENAPAQRKIRLIVIMFSSPTPFEMILKTGGEYTREICIASCVSIAVSLLNFVLFYFGSRHGMRFTPKHISRQTKYKRQVKVNKGVAKHKCAICGRTELDAENLAFRYCSKCEGNYEYCQDHLFTHEHVKK